MPSFIKKKILTNLQKELNKAKKELDDLEDLLRSEKKEKEGIESANEFVYSILSLVFNFTVCIALVTIIFSKPILKYIIGFKDEFRIETANILLNKL